jgi:indole-3-glycerol phosphate synthase
LIVAALDDDRLARLHETALEAGVAALVEVHDEAEAERALAIDPMIVGVNNRDLTTFRVDLGNSEVLAPMLDSVPVKIAESGISSCEDASRMRKAGFDAVLVGESLVTSGDAAGAINALQVR